MVPERSAVWDRPIGFTTEVLTSIPRSEWGVDVRVVRRYHARPALRGCRGAPACERSRAREGFGPVGLSPIAFGDALVVYSDGPRYDNECMLFYWGRDQ